MSVSVLRAPVDRIGQANSTHQIGHNLAQVVWAQVAGILAGILGYQGMFPGNADSDLQQVLFSLLHTYIEW